MINNKSMKQNEWVLPHNVNVQRKTKCVDVGLKMDAETLKFNNSLNIINKKL